MNKIEPVYLMPESDFQLYHSNLTHFIQALFVIVQKLTRLLGRN